MFAPPICRRSRRDIVDKELASNAIVSSDPMKTAARSEHRNERSEQSDKASLASEAIKPGSRSGVLRRREQTRFIVCE